MSALFLSDEEIAAYELVTPMLESLHKEMSELSKKKQDGLLNKLKIRHANRLLSRIERVLDDDPSVEYLEKFDEDDIPQNSDAVVILGQWQAALRQFHRKHTFNDHGRRRWRRGEPHEDNEPFA